MKRRQMPKAVFFCLFGLLLSSCQSTEEPVGKAGGGGGRNHRPLVLFWTHHPEELVNITHFTPYVWIHDRNSGERGNPYTEQSHLIARGVLPLDWRGGAVNADRSVEQLVDYWCRAEREGYVGIAIDEFVSWGANSSVNAKLARALVLTKQNCPDLFIAVWHGGLLSRQLAEAFREGADLVLLESYVAGSFVFRLALSYNLLVARAAGISDKAVFALEIKGSDPDAEELSSSERANSADVLEAQMRWIKKNAPEMPGIAFFAPGAGLELLKKADHLAGEIFD